tara:strand:- start:178 stop:462 length:285 start_codon:yes stop_codon:yes gene_type:complete
VFDVRLKPYLSEKTNNLVSQNKIVFLNLGSKLNKIQWKQYFSDVHDIQVDAVHTLVKESKQRRRGRVVGFTKERQKIVVTVRDSENFEKLKALV